MKKEYKNRCQEKGFSLLEVLVALVLIAVGIVTMVMMQSKTLQYSNSAFYQGLGMQIANGLAASVRVNPDGLASYSRDGSYNPDEAIPVVGACYTTECTPAQIAAADIAWARRSARSLLPGGDVFIMPKTNGFLDLVLVWNGSKTMDGVTLPCDGYGINVTAVENAQCLLLKVGI